MLLFFPHIFCQLSLDKRFLRICCSLDDFGTTKNVVAFPLNLLRAIYAECVICSRFFFYVFEFLFNKSFGDVGSDNNFIQFKAFCIYPPVYASYLIIFYGNVGKEEITNTVLFILFQDILLDFAKLHEKCVASIQLIVSFL